MTLLYKLQHIKIITFIVSLLFIGCNDKSTTTKEIFNGFTSQPVNFLNKKAYIPSNYKKINLNELGEMLKQNPDLNKLDKMNYRLATSSYNQSGKTPVLYQDTIVNTNSIWFLPGSYVPLDKTMVNDFVTAAEKQLLIPAQYQGINYKRLEAKFIKLNALKAIKVKYKLIFNDNIRYLTQYIITKQLETYSMIVTHEYNEDFQKVLKSL